MNWRKRISWLLQEFDFRTDRKRILFLLEALGITLLICQVFYSSLTAFIFLLPLTAAIYLRSKKREDEKRCQELVTEFKECMNSLLTALKAGYSCENAFRAAEEEMIVFYGKHSEIVCGLNRIVGGLDRVYELGKVFRNEGMDKNHSPEFTSMEAYMAYGNLEDMMDLMEQVVYKCAMAVNGSPIITYEGKSFDVTPPWNKIDMTETVIKVTGIPFDKIDGDEEARAAAIKYGMAEEDVKNWTRGKIIAEMFEEYCEDLPGLLDGPVFLTGHPVDVSPLSKRDPKDPRITRRFEAYINGWELSNAFSELNDPIDQYERFAEQQRELDLGIDDEAHPMDTDYVNALEIGLPPTGGIGIGIDRLVMLITDSTTIRDVQLFPVMKPLAGE